MNERGHEEINLGLLAYRAEANSNAIRRLEEWRSVVDAQMATLLIKVDDLGSGVKNMQAQNKEGFGEINNQIKSLRANWNRILMAVTGSAIAFSFSILAATGKI